MARSGVPGRVRGQRPGEGRRWKALLFWASLLLAITAVISGLRYQEAPQSTCVAKLDPIVGASSGNSLVDRVGDRSTAQIVRYRFQFDNASSDPAPKALTIGRATPFYQLKVNGSELTPAVDLTAGNIRDMAPHLHALPADVLRQGLNVAEFELPASHNLGPASVEQVCFGSLAAMEPAFQANWWRMVGQPTAFAMLFGAMVVLALALWWLSGRQSAYAWYVVCLLPLMERSVYLATPARPGSPVLWIVIGNLSLTILPHALYGFMSAYWRFSLPRLEKFLRVATVGALLCLVFMTFAAQSRASGMVGGLFVLLVSVSGLAVVGAITRRLHALYWIEKGVVVWIGLFAFFVSLPEIINFHVPFAQRWMWTNPPAMAVVAMGLGYLLLRRMVVGSDLFAAATDAAAVDLDHALTPGSMPAARMWAEVSSGIAMRERRRMIADIHDGFGSRLVAVLVQARREFPHSAMHVDIQRALLDMRLMIDAMDDSSRSLEVAMARFRHRLESAISAAGVDCEWKLDAIGAVVIEDRRKLVSLYRCLEELLNSSLRHSGANTLSVDTTATRRMLQIGIADDGVGIPSTGLPIDHGFERASIHAQAMGGSLRIGTGDDGIGTRCTLIAPLF